MPSFSSLRRYIKRAPRPSRGAAAALFALCVGWTLAFAHTAQLSPGAGHSQNSTRVRIAAELRVGAPAPAPVADVVDGQASLRALHARVRYAPNQHPLASRNPYASARHDFTLRLPLSVRPRASEASGEGAEAASHLVIARRWPLPRSNCDSDPDADAARQS